MEISGSEIGGIQHPDLSKTVIAPISRQFSMPASLFLSSDLSEGRALTFTLIHHPRSSGGGSHQPRQSLGLSAFGISII